MNTLVVIALLLVVPALYVQGGALQPSDPPPTPTSAPQTNPPEGTDAPKGGKSRNEYGPRRFLDFMKKVAATIRGYAKDLKETKDILQAPDFKPEVLEQKMKDLEKVEESFESTEDFLGHALYSIFGHPECHEGPPPALCGSLVRYMNRVQAGEIPFNKLVGTDMAALDFGCLGAEIEKAFDKFDKDSQGTPTPEEVPDLIFRTLMKISSIGRAERCFFELLEKEYPEEEGEEEEEEEEEEGGDKKRQMKDELLKLLLKRVLGSEPANKRSFGALLGRHLRK